MTVPKRMTFETDLDTYTSSAIIGEGGSGRVYRVEGTGGEFAIKLLDSNRATTAKVKRFTNELNFGRRTRHDHIVPILDSGYVDVNGSAAPFFVMAKYERSLREMIVEGIESRHVLNLYGGLLSAVALAHGRNVWHRDIKPENVLHDSATNRLLLADFGIAHFEEEDLATAVQTGDAERLANFQYAAPEQRTRGAVVDQRGDIYALGLILNELFTGAVPHGTSYRRIASAALPYAFLDQVVDKMIRSDREERYSSVEAVRQDLQLLAVGPGLAKARQVSGKVLAAVEKERLFNSEEGVSRATEQVNEAYLHMLELLSVVQKESPVLKLEFERARDEIVVRTRRASAHINWHRSFSNRMDTARVTIWTYKWRLLLPSQRGTYSNSVEPEEMGEFAFRPDYTGDRGLCWVDESGHNLSALELGDRLVEEFMGAVEAQELSDEEPEDY